MSTKSNGSSTATPSNLLPRAPHMHLQETALTFSRLMAPSEFSYIIVRGRLGYGDSYTVLQLSSTGGHSITDDEVVYACASLRLRHPLLASKVNFNSPTIPELTFTSPLTQAHAVRAARAQIEFHTFDDQEVAAAALCERWLSTEADDVLDIRDATCSLYWAKSIDPKAGQYIFGLRTTHFITDGRRRLNLVRCFMDLLATPGRARKELAAHFSGKTPLVEMPPTLESLIPKSELSEAEDAKAQAAFEELVKFMDKARYGLITNGPANGENMIPRCIRHVWNHDETAHILKACKTRGVTITNLVNVAGAFACVRSSPYVDSVDEPVDDSYYFEYSQTMDLNTKVPRTSNNGEGETALRMRVYPVVISVPRASAQASDPADVKTALWDAARQLRERSDAFVQSPYFWRFLDLYGPFAARRYFATLAGTAKPYMPYMSSLGDLKNILPAHYQVARPEANGHGANGLGGGHGAEIVIKDQATGGRMDPQMVAFLLYTFDGKLHLQFKWDAKRTSEAWVDNWFKRTVGIVSDAASDASG